MSRHVRKRGTISLGASLNVSSVAARREPRPTNLRAQPGVWRSSFYRCRFIRTCCEERLSTADSAANSGGGSACRCEQPCQSLAAASDCDSNAFDDWHPVYRAGCWNCRHGICSFQTRRHTREAGSQSDSVRDERAVSGDAKSNVPGPAHFRHRLVFRDRVALFSDPTDCVFLDD